VYIHHDHTFPKQGEEEGMKKKEEKKIEKGKVGVHEW
jgi:hypothetical protein